MKVLVYNEFDPQPIPSFSKPRKYLEDDNLKSTDMKKIGDSLYRLKLNQHDRLLFSIYH